MTNREYYEKLGLYSRVVTEVLNYRDIDYAVSYYYKSKHSDELIKLYSTVLPKDSDYLDFWMSKTYHPFDYITVVDNREDYKHGYKQD